VGQRAQACGHIECRTAERTVLQPDRLARIDPDSDAQGKLRIGVRFLRELLLQIHRGSNRPPRRVEDSQSLVAPDFDQRPAANLHTLAGEIAKSRR
jgi:hypothetical protein